MNIRLEAEPRSDFGKGAARRLRRSGRIPVVLYGDGTELLHLSLPGHDLEQALRKPKVTLEIVHGSATTLTKPRDVQRDPVRRTIEHVDLIVVSAAEARERAAEADLWYVHPGRHRYLRAVGGPDRNPSDRASSMHSIRS